MSNTRACRLLLRVILSYIAFVRSDLIYYECIMAYMPPLCIEFGLSFMLLLLYLLVK